MRQECREGGLPIKNLHFADDVSLLTESPKELHTIIHRMVKISKNIIIKVNFEKTEMQHMRRVHKDFNIIIKNQSLKQTVDFVYLGRNLISKERTISEEYGDSEGCIPGIKKGLVSKSHNDNKIKKYIRHLF